MVFSGRHQKTKLVIGKGAWFTADSHDLAELLSSVVPVLICQISATKKPGYLCQIVTHCLDSLMLWLHPFCLFPLTLMSPHPLLNCEHSRHSTFSRTTLSFNFLVGNFTRSSQACVKYASIIKSIIGQSIMLA